MASLSRIRRALGQGVVLAVASTACGIVADGGTPAGGGTGGASGGGASSGGATLTGGGAGGGMASGGSPGAELEPYPLEGLGCSGEVYPDDSGGYSGQCCATAECYSPTDGVCPAPYEAGRENLPLPVGSGTCECGDGVSGPYAPRNDHEPNSAGTCCYVIPKVGCEGRPFIVDDRAVLAPLVRRGDWGAAPAQRMSLA